MRVTLRRAARDDALFLWRLRNSDAVRKNSFDMKKIPLPAHMQWFRKTLQGAKSDLFIVRCGTVAAGQVRFDRAGDVYTANIALGARFRGRGIGARALRIACHRILKRHPAARIQAFIKPENAGSCACFSKAGFSRSGMAAVRDVRCLRYVYSRRQESKRPQGGPV